MLLVYISMMTHEQISFHMSLTRSYSVSCYASLLIFQLFCCFFQEQSFKNVTVCTTNLFHGSHTDPNAQVKTGKSVKIIKYQLVKQTLSNEPETLVELSGTEPQSVSLGNTCDFPTVSCQNGCREKALQALQAPNQCTYGKVNELLQLMYLKTYILVRWMELCSLLESLYLQV